MGIRTRVKKSPTVAEFNESDAAETVTKDERALSVRVAPLNRLESSSAVNCSLLMRASARSWNRAALDMFVDVLDSLGSRMTNLSSGGGDFLSDAETRRNKISILAFEVAKTILRGSRLMQSLSDVNVSFLKTTVFSSKGVRTLISEDDDELLRIAAADKREELESFLKEITRFGNICIDWQWHNLGPYFASLRGELTQQKCLVAESAMQQLMTLVQNTALLLSELWAFDKVDKVYCKSLEEENISTTVLRGDLANLKAERKKRIKTIQSYKKKTLWSKNFEEVVEKLVVIAHFLLLKINVAFGNADVHSPIENSNWEKKKLGPAGIELHYAKIITQIDILGTLSVSAPEIMREALYQRLPRRITSALPVKLRSFQVELECHQIKAEMDKVLQWLSPIARNTTKALQDFDPNGGLANLKSEGNDIMRIETLYHADTEKTEACILELLMWLHHLMSRARNDASSNPPNRGSTVLSVKDKEMLESVGGSIVKGGIVSRSQNFATLKTRLSRTSWLTKSSREYRSSDEIETDHLARWRSNGPVSDFDIGWIRTLDVIDGLEST